MVETLTGTNRSKGITYDELLDMDTHAVPARFREDSPMPPGPTIVDPAIYYSRDFFDLEVERLWKKVWQMACHEDDIPHVGDSHVYDIAHLSYIIVRTAPDEIKAFPNACLHRGRALLTEHAKGLREFRCPLGLEDRRHAEGSAVPVGLPLGQRAHPFAPPRQGRALGRVRVHQPRRQCRKLRRLPRGY